MLTTLLPVLTGVLGQVVKSIFPNPEDELKRLDLQNKINLAIIEQSGSIEKAAADIIKAEAQGDSPLQRNWRPIMMLSFTVLIAARWFGFAAPNLSEAEYVKLWDIVQLGLGGYVIGRSVEKIAPSVAEALKNK